MIRYRRVHTYGSPKAARTDTSTVWAVIHDGTFIGWAWLCRAASGYGRYSPVWKFVPASTPDADPHRATSRKLAARYLVKAQQEAS